MEGNKMVTYVALKIKETHDKQGLTQAQALYRAFFISTAIYNRYKADVDTILTVDGYGDCIVAE